MTSMNKKIVITGGTGRFGALLKQKKNNDKLFFPTKNELNLLNMLNEFRNIY